MPWDKDNYPNSMKNLSPKRREKAISIANAILRNGGSEGLSISTGIKRSKHMGLVKMAFLLPLGGAVLGAHIGHKFDNDDDHKTGARIGALVGAIAGGGAHYGLYRAAKKANFGYYGRPGGEYHMPRPPRRASADNIESFFKEHGNIPHTNIKTKKEAKSVYRQASMKHHPDMPGGNTEKFQKINNDWHEIENSHWFEKLAFLRDGKWFKHIMAAIKSGNNKYLVENYDKIKEKLEGPIL